MYAFFLTVLCALAIQGSAWDFPVQSECCNNIRGFKECKRECEKVWVESKSGLKLKLALSLPKVCPSHLNSLWKCFNSSIKGFHLYTKWNLLNGKSCCLLAISESCREACFFNTNVKYLQQSRCPKNKETSLLSCIDRNAASRKCCKNIHYRRCERACENVFSSDKEPNRKKIRAVKRACKKRRRVFKCVDNFIGSATKSSVPDHKCCKLTTTTKCHDVCREVMSSKKAGEEKINLLKNSCRAEHPFHHKVWPCFLRYSVPVEPVVNRKPKKDYRVDVTLHCCLRAKTEQCLKLCFKTYSKGGEVARDFQRRCEFKPDETTMLTCIADVSMPCHIGCSGLGFCTNFNHRHTELFRSCNRAADSAAKRDFENWWEKGRVEIPAMDFIPVKDIKKCLPDMWKAVACVLQIKPCHVKSHGSAICREDCLKVLGECAKKQQLGVRNVEMICKGLSPDEQTSCISLASYIKPSLYKNETNEVTHPCYPNPCKNNDVCEINREFTGRNNNKKFVSYRCTPGCPIDHQSKLLVKNGDFARLPIVDNYKSEGCFKICRCDQERLSDCPPSPSCVKRKPCSVQGSKESYKHHDTFYKDCNLCVCFDGEVTCSKKQCISGAAFNGTGRPRRNHSPKDDNNGHANTGLPCSCKANYSASCGTNGKTYRSFCLALCARLQEHQISEGACSSKDPCDSVSCGEDKFCAIDRKICIGTDSLCQQYMCVPKSQDCRNVTTELICDTENNQHFNRCSLHKSGKEIAYSGVCKASCAPGRQEVCGVDGQTYSSECALNHARMLMDYKGPCTTIGKYTNEDPIARCAYIQCPILKPSHCIGITPSGACCKVCATQLVVLFSEIEVSKTNKIVMDKTQPITQERVVSRVRRYLSVSECDIFGFYSTHGDFVLLVKAITENPSKLQFVICNKEAQKIETLVHTASPMFTSDEILSSFRAVSSTTPQLSENLSEKKSSAFTCRFTGLSLLVPFMIAFVW